jgi:hypothetical protein
MYPLIMGVDSATLKGQILNIFFFFGFVGMTCDKGIIKIFLKKNNLFYAL